MTANEINTLGVFLLILAHFTLSISDKRDKIAFLLSGIGAVVVAYGSYLLQSWPIVVLNVIWCYLSFNKFSSLHFKNDNKLCLITKTYIKLKTQKISLLMALIVAILSIAVFSDKGSAMLGVTIYFISYALLSSSAIGKKEYLIASLVGYLFIVPHLIFVGSWPVLFNETIGFTIALIGIVRLLFVKNPPSMAD